MRKSIYGLAVILACGLAACVQQQPPAPMQAAQPVAAAPAPAPQITRIRGTIQKVDGDKLTLKLRDGRTGTVTLAQNVSIRTMVKKRLSDIKTGDYVGSTSVQGKDGKLHALEVHIFSEPPRSVGQSNWDLKPGSLMTNAPVTGMAKAPQGNTLTVTYNNTTTTVIVDAKTPIVGYGPGDKTALRRGRAVFVIATPGADGTLTASSVSVEKNGVKPPM